MSITDGLNEEQLRPVLATEGAVLVTAGAGSGKTRLLTHRIAYLILEKEVSPYNILAITFTNKAANEMKERVNRMVPHGNLVWVSTFHSLCVNILRRDADRLGYTKNFSIYSDTERNRVLKEIYTELRIEDDSAKKNIEYHISAIKNNNRNAFSYLEELPEYMDTSNIKQVYVKYAEALKRNNAMDFDDLLVKTYELFAGFPEVLQKYQDRFRYIHVDEFQDTNIVQYDIVRMLAGKWGNILVVGDEDQCIYGWRGANIQNIINFKKDFPEAQIFKLEQNYRSTKNILDAANKVISNNFQRLKKTLWTENDTGAEVEYYVGDSDREEADYVTQKIYEMVKYEGYKYSDFAILIRVSAPSRLFEDYMLQYNLPYKVLGGFKFFERMEVKNVIAYMRAVVNPRDNESFTRIINYPKRGIGDTTLALIRDHARGGSISDVILDVENYTFTTSVGKKLSAFRDLYVDLCKAGDTMPVDKFAEYLVDRVGFKEAFNTGNEEDYNRLLNVNSFVTSVKEYVESNPEATLSEYLESVTLISDIDTVSEGDEYVLLSTVHAVKGLEFKIVFVSALEEGLFPIVRSGDRPSDLEEERRLMYVAATRARERLFLTRSKRRFMYNEVRYQEPSRFLKEMGYGIDETRPNVFPGAPEVCIPKSKPHTTTPSIQNVLNGRISAQKKDLSAYVVGTTVLHPKFGAGKIVDDSGLHANRMVTIDFGAVGLKTLSLDYAPLQIVKK